MFPVPVTHPPTTQPPRLLDQFRDAARARGHSAPTTDVLAAWARRFILFHDKQHPASLGLPQVTSFLEHVVKTETDPLPALAIDEDPPGSPSLDVPSRGR